MKWIFQNQTHTPDQHKGPGNDHNILKIITNWFEDPFHQVYLLETTHCSKDTENGFVENTNSKSRPVRLGIPPFTATVPEENTGKIVATMWSRNAKLFGIIEYFPIHGSVHCDTILIRFNKMQHYAGIYLL